jgi:hypothetical protein
VSDTQKTDAIAFMVTNGHDRHEVVFSDFARTQERTIAQLVDALKEAVDLAVIGDINEETSAHGYGKWLKRSRLAIADATREHWCCEKGKALNVAVCPECLESFGRIPE